jgi:hypothetical protein
MRTGQPEAGGKTSGRVRERAHRRERGGRCLAASGSREGTRTPTSLPGRVAWRATATEATEIEEGGEVGVRREDRPRLQAQPTKGGARPAGDQTLPHLSPRVIEMPAPASNGPRAGRQACRFSLQRRGEDEKCRARAKALVRGRRPTSPRSARTTPSGRTEMGAARRQRSGRSFGSAFKAEPSSSGPSSTLSRRKAHPSRGPTHERAAGLER